MDKISVHAGSTVKCPACQQELALEVAEVALVPVRPHGIRANEHEYLYFPTHSYSGNIGSTLPCRYSRSRVTERGLTKDADALWCGVLAIEFNPGTVAGVSFSDVMSILEDADLDIYNDYGTDRVDFSNRAELAERVMKLLASRAG